MNKSKRVVLNSGYRTKPKEISVSRGYQPSANASSKPQTAPKPPAGVASAVQRPKGE
ncbi:MAG: hypothetical protein KDK02_05215 [Rhodobacteraceae bacterium]|nr:hypothetical protein [Paracoccaceae bacterium]